MQILKQSIYNKYFELIHVELSPQLKVLAIFIRKSGHCNMSEQCNHIQKVRAHTVSLRHGHTDTDRLCIHLPFIEFFPI